MDKQGLLNHLESSAKQANCEHDWQGKANQVYSKCKKSRNIVFVSIRTFSRTSKQPLIAEHKHRFVRLGKHYQICLTCDKKEKIKI